MGSKFFFIAAGLVEGAELVRGSLPTRPLMERDSSERERIHCFLPVAAAVLVVPSRPGRYFLVLGRFYE